MLEIVEKFVVAVVDITHVFIVRVSNGLKSQDPCTNDKMFMERVGPPVVQVYRGDHRL